jgi:hypothetical protein
MLADDLIEEIMFLKSGRHVHLEKITMSKAVNDQLIAKQDVFKKGTAKVVTELLDIPVTVSPRLEGAQAGIEYTVGGISKGKTLYDVDKNIRRG